MNPNSSKIMDSQLTGMWVNFFTAAGIPSDVGATYSLTFTENRIQLDMLLDLNKEYLKDMGITRMGDVIAILRHAKQVHESAARDRVLSSATASAKVPVAAITGRLTAAAAAAAPSKPYTPASRILEHYTRNTTPESSPPRVTHKRKSPDTIPVTSATDIKKSRLIRFGSKQAVTVHEASATKTVFARLGNTEATNPVAATSAGKPIFSRLGAKTDPSAPTYTHTDTPVIHIPVPRDALKYEGILKAVTPKPMTVTASKSTGRTIAIGPPSRLTPTMRADEPPLSVKEKLAVPRTKSVKFSNTVEYKEIARIPKTGAAVAEFSPVFNKPERRLTMPDGVMLDNSVKARLGAKNVSNLTITKNVFNRLSK